MGDFYVWVNVPEYKVRVVKDGRIVHSERVIIGKLANQTPMFSDELETLYFHPKWHVPQSIKVNELYPSLARGGGYFRKQGLRLNYNGRPVNPNSVDWSTADIRRFHVYQPPGGANVLGKVKFTFPNKHQVYLHDTPTKQLFKKTTRTFSHGCVRVRNPLRLAEVILEHSNGMTADDVEAIVNGPLRETPVKTDQKVPVHITYFTSLIDEDGTEQAFKDVYGHEKKIKLALQGRFDQIAVGRDHLAPVKLKPRQAYTGTTAVEVFFNNLFGGF
jgi:L,D-transpeptidase YcbB